MSISVEKVKLELNRIKLLGFVENVKSDDNDGAIGNTFEHYLGVEENNLKDADFEGWEIKTKKQYSKTRSLNSTTYMFNISKAYA